MVGVVVNWGQRYAILTNLPKEKREKCQFVYKIYKKRSNNLVVLPKNTNFAGKNV